jgi:hypothetical protein
METLLKLLDDLDDFASATAFRLRRQLSPPVRERRRTPRISPPKVRHAR